MVATGGHTHRRELRGWPGRFLDLSRARLKEIDRYVIDPASIPFERHQRRPKTDRLDAIKLVTNLRAWMHAERGRMHVVRVPSSQDEATRHLMRERGQLQKEVLQRHDRMRKLLATHGCFPRAFDHGNPLFAAVIGNARVVPATMSDGWV
jgi:hypothetical protein